MIHTIIHYGNPALKVKTEPVMAVTPAVLSLIADMLETMHDSAGLGLAATQIARTERLCVIDIPAEAEKEGCRAFNAPIAMPLIMINPVIIASEGEQRNSEGCLSFPEIHAPVRRAFQVTARYLDAAGIPQLVTAQGLLARAIQHELDHLDGVLFVERLSFAQKTAISGQLKRLAKQK